MSTHEVSPVSIFGAGAVTATAGVALDGGAAISQNAVPAVSKINIAGISILFTAFYSFHKIVNLIALPNGCLNASQTSCQSSFLINNYITRCYYYIYIISC
jgi:hypothetical protein